MQMKFSNGQSEFSRVFNFTILWYLQNLRKLDAREKLVFYSRQFRPAINVCNIHYEFYYSAEC